MDNRLTNLLLLIVIIFGCYWFWKQPETHGDAVKIKNAIATIGDQTIDAAAKASNKIEDSHIGQKTEKAFENAKEKVAETGDGIKHDFEADKKKDREQE